MHPSTARIGRTITRGPGGTLGVNMTPMIDVVFLLLIYFLLATDFVINEEVYQLDLPPRPAAGTPTDPFELEDEPLRVSVVTTGAGPGDYSLTLSAPWPQPATFEDLYTFLRQSLIVDRGAGLFAADHPVLVAPAPDAAWEHTVEAFSAAVRAGYRNVQFVPSS